MSALNSNYHKNNILKEAPTAKAGIDLVQSMRSKGELSQAAPQLSAALLSNESFSNATIKGEVQDMTKALGDSIQGFFMQNPTINGREVTAQQKQAVQYALLTAQNPRASIQRTGNVQTFKPSHGLEVFIPDHTGLDPSKLGARTLEAYDTKPNEEMLQFTAAFALATATQLRLPEMFFKTVNLGPDQYSVEMEIPLISVHDQVRHELETRVAEFGRRMIVDAEVDHTILKNDTLKVTPIVRQQTLDAFVDPALVAAKSVILESGETVQTAPLRTNYRTTFMRVSQTDAQLAKGPQDQTDAFDPGAVLTGVLVSFTDADDKTEVVRFDTTNSPTNQFVTAQQGMSRLMQLNFVTDAATISKDTLLENGAVSTILDAFQGPTAHTAWLSFSMSGSIDLRDGNYEILAGSVTANQLKTATGLVLSPDDAANAALFNLLASAKIIGFEADVRKVNSNLRELGQLADFNTYRQVYGISLGSPLAVQRPITNGDSQDALHAAALSYMCKVRQANLAITQLISERATLRQFKKRSNILGRQPEIMGISSYLVQPTLIELEIDLSVAVTTTAQHERNADIKALLTDTCTVVGYKLWEQSRWQAAANLLEGTDANPPIIKLGTDQVLTQYLITTGDTRTVGPDFGFEKAWSMDERMRDHIYIALGYQSSTPGVPHPLDHGMMLQKQEVVAALNLSRGSHSRELIVHPSFRHITLCPILGVIKVIGLVPSLTEKAALGVTVLNAEDFPVAP